MPVVDDEDQKYGGHRFLGFILLHATTPRKIHARRGEIFYDMQEGGPAPTMKLGRYLYL